jgi:hypothetical protein
LHTYHIPRFRYFSTYYQGPQLLTGRTRFTVNFYQVRRYIPVQGEEKRPFVNLPSSSVTLRLPSFFCLFDGPPHQLKATLAASVQTDESRTPHIKVTQTAGSSHTSVLSGMDKIRRSKKKSFSLPEPNTPSLSSPLPARIGSVPS